MTLQTTTKTDGATGLFTVTAARLPELIDEIGMGMFQIIQFLPVLFVPLCEGANILVPRPRSTVKGPTSPPPFFPFPDLRGDDERNACLEAELPA